MFVLMLLLLLLLRRTVHHQVRHEAAVNARRPR